MEMKIKGTFGAIISIYRTATSTWAWKDEKGYGFTNESLDYILEYLKESGLIHY